MEKRDHCTHRDKTIHNSIHQRNDSEGNCAVICIVQTEDTIKMYKSGTHYAVAT